MNDNKEVLGLSAAQIRVAGAQWTTQEIGQQPRLWPQIAQQVRGEASVAQFLAPLLQDPALRIVLTGAGSSSYIGTCLAPALCKAGRRAEAIPTTDIVANPGAAFAERARTLVIHFARSGNSPESGAALELAEQLVADCHHLIVTCNGQGQLRRRAGATRHAAALVLPEACNDQSFAMTSSFSGMLLAAGLLLGVIPSDVARLANLAHAGAEILARQLPLVSALVRAQFDRVVYLGSGELKGLAQEAALKMLELTDGRVVSVGESPLGFRHGPKTIVNGSTLVVTFVSSDAYTRRYDLDLISELRRDAVAGRVIAVSAAAPGAPDSDTVIVGEPGAATDLELCLPYVVFAQMLATLRSVSLGLSPDQPNAAGTVSRVVKGVSLYPFPPRS